MEVKDKAVLIVEALKKETGINPVEIFKKIAKEDFVAIHGPEHHILDGGSILVAYKNAGGDIDLDQALETLMERGLKMPGAMCGQWGVCGAITSVGAALAIIDQTGPLSTDGTWGEHMTFTASAVTQMAQINGPRCCKRDGMIAFENGIKYINEHYDVTLPYSAQECEFTAENMQCIRERCPYYKKA